MAPMPEPRDGFGSVVLGDGSLLIVGDDHACHPGSAEAGSERAVIYDPNADRWTSAPSLNKPRIQFAMVPTVDGGAMVIGGVNAEDQPFSSTKIFSVGAQTWTDGPLLDRARGGPAAATIADGRIFVGSLLRYTSETTMTSDVEVFAPWIDGWAEGGRMDVALERLLPLSDGRLLAIGSGFEMSDLMLVATPGGAEGWREFAGPDFGDVTELVALAHGDILAIGRGRASTGTYEGERAARYDRGKDRWIEVAPVPTPRDEPQVGLLGDGRVVVAGGVERSAAGGQGKISRTTEIYDPGKDSWGRGPDLLAGRYEGVAVTLADGSLLVMGGTAALNTAGDTPFCPGVLTSVERLSPGT